MSLPNGPRPPITLSSWDRLREEELAMRRASDAFIPSQRPPRFFYLYLNRLQPQPLDKYR